MTIHSIAAYLQSFDPAEEPVAPPGDTERQGEDADEAALSPRKDVEAIRQELEAAFALRLQTQREEHESALALARDRWAQEEGRALAGLLTQSLDAAIEDLRTDVARVIAPFVAGGVARQTVDDLIRVVRDAIADDGDPAIRIGGPRDLIEKIGQALNATNAAVSLVERGGADVVIDLKGARIETRLAAWTHELTRAMGEAQ